MVTFRDMSWLCSWLIGLGLEISNYFKTFGIPGKLQYGLHVVIVLFHIPLA